VGDGCRGCARVSPHHAQLVAEASVDRGFGLHHGLFLSSDIHKRYGLLTQAFRFALCSMWEHAISHEVHICNVKKETIDSEY
jgi:hypothetical protein